MKMEITSIQHYKNWVIKILMLCASFSCLAQTTDTNNVNRIFTEKQLQEDLSILKYELETKHPGLYTYSTKSQMDSAFKEIQESVQSELTAINFFKKIAILNSVIKDAHTRIISPENFRTARDKTLPRFPFAIHIENDRVFVLRNLSHKKEIAPGWEILKINDEPVDDIVLGLLNTRSRDGFNETGPSAKLNLYFSGLYATVKGCPEFFNTEFNDLQGSEVKLKIKALVHDDVILNYEKKYGKSAIENAKAISYDMNGNRAVLKVSSFGGGVIKDAGQSYKKEFKKLFETIKNKKIENLIIDVRDNQGGWDEVGDELLSYLVPVSFDRRKSDVSLVNSIENEDYYAKDDYIKHFKKLKFKKIDSGYSVIWNEKPIKPKKSLFTGKLFVLINGVSASQTGLFAGSLKDKTNALFIGEETGGNPKEVCGGDIITLTLPNSKVQVEIPLRKLIANVAFENIGRGVIPEYEIRQTLNDKVSDHDSVLEFAINLIAQKGRANKL